MTDMHAERQGIDSGGKRAAAPARTTASAPDLQRRRVRLYLLLIAIDAVLIAASFLFASLLRFGDPISEVGLRTFAVLLPIYFAIATNGRAYSLAALTRPRYGALRAARAWIFAIIAVVFIFFLLKVSEDFSRLVFGIGSGAALVAIIAGRLVAGTAIGRRYDWTFRRDMLLLDGSPISPVPHEETIDAAEHGLVPTIDDPEMLDRLAKLLGRCDCVILSCPQDKREAWVAMLRGAGVDVEIAAPELAGIGAIALRRHDRRTTLLVAAGPIGLRDRAMKRALDLGVALPALILLAPLMLLIALAVRLESPGPALFRQPRMGRGNRKFDVLKFRTMRAEAEDTEGAQSASLTDQRITRLGRLLRSTSLDELPQLWNVVRGEMSLVGPRPHALGSTAEEEAFWEIDRRYWDRHAIKPGMTGLAQVRGLRGATERREDLSDRLQADLEYLSGWSLGRDVAILARTALVLVHRKAF